MNAAQLAWAVGLFEGEGCILHVTRAGHRRRALFLGMTDEDVVLRFADLMSCGTVRVVPRRDGHKTLFQWRLYEWSELERVLRAMLPLLGERRAEKARALLADPPRRSGPTRWTSCLRGHELAGANLYVDPRGRRHCRACRRERMREARRAA